MTAGGKFPPAVVFISRKVMKRNEQLLREYIRESLVTKKATFLSEGIKVGELKAAMEFAKGKKLEDARKEAAKEVANVALQRGMKALINLATGGMAEQIINAIEAGQEIRGIYKASKVVPPEEKKKNPMWDLITIDPDTSAIVDDAIETEFVDLLADRIKYLDDEDELPDADTQLANFLKSKFNKAHVTKGQ